MKFGDVLGLSFFFLSANTARNEASYNGIENMLSNVEGNASP